MILPFHILSLLIRITVSLFLVFLLQFRYEEKSLEKHLLDFSKKFFISKVLDEASSKTARSVANRKKSTPEENRKKSEALFDKFLEKINAPAPPKKEQESK